MQLSGRTPAGDEHTCALLEGGTVRCWGNASQGQLGYGNIDTIGDDEPPAQAGDVNLGGVAVQITAGRFHTCALLQDGAVRCWGNNGAGQLGLSNTTNVGDDEPPAEVGDALIGGTALKVDAGAYHTCALLDSGAIRCWGYNYYGQLGQANTDNVGDDESPETIAPVDLGGAAIDFDAAVDHTCALLENGDVVCWGSGQYGQLGYGNGFNIGDDELPSAVGPIAIDEGVAQLALGGGAPSPLEPVLARTCILLATGAVRCWGFGHDGQLGYGNTLNIFLASSAGDVDYE